MSKLLLALTFILSSNSYAIYILPDPSKDVTIRYEVENETGSSSQLGISIANVSHFNDRHDQNEIAYSGEFSFDQIENCKVIDISLELSDRGNEKGELSPLKKATLSYSLWQGSNKFANNKIKLKYFAESQMIVICRH